MGKRKAKKVNVKKAATPKLDTEFSCIVCNNPKCIDVKLSRSQKVGYLRCRMCRHEYCMNIKPLDVEVDVYSSWVDAHSASTSAGKSKADALPMIGRFAAHVKHDSETSTASSNKKGLISRIMRGAGESVKSAYSSVKFAAGRTTYSTGFVDTGTKSRKGRGIAASVDKLSDDEGIDVQHSEDEFDRYSDKEKMTEEDRNFIVHDEGADSDTEFLDPTAPNSSSKKSSKKRKHSSSKHSTDRTEKSKHHKHKDAISSKTAHSVTHRDNHSPPASPKALHLANESPKNASADETASINNTDTNAAESSNFDDFFDGV